MKNVRTPQFVSDLYRDLRDRRLLLPALVLLVAVVVVPLALSSPSQPVPPALAPPASADADQATAAESAVLVHQPGVTNYKKRLELKSKNPFSAKFTAVPKSAKLQTASGTGVTPTAPTTSSAPSGGATSTTPSSSTSTSSSSTPSTPTVPSTPPSVPKPRRRITLYTYRLDVKAGRAGDLTEHKGVKRLDVLPSSSAPVVMFLSVSEGGKQAAFVVSDDVESVSGDGKCVPTHDHCQFLLMKPGQEKRFVYGPDGKTYVLKLQAIRSQKIGNKPPKSVNRKVSPANADSLLGAN